MRDGFVDDGLSLLSFLLPVGCQLCFAGLKFMLSFIFKLQGRHWDGGCRSRGGGDSSRDSGDGGCRHCRGTGVAEKAEVDAGTESVGPLGDEEVDFENLANCRFGHRNNTHG